MARVRLKSEEKSGGKESKEKNVFVKVSNCVVLCCQAVVSATNRSFIQRNPTECGVPNVV